MRPVLWEGILPSDLRRYRVVALIGSARAEDMARTWFLEALIVEMVDGSHAAGEDNWVSVDPHRSLFVIAFAHVARQVERIPHDHPEDQSPPITL